MRGGSGELGVWDGGDEGYVCGSEDEVLNDGKDTTNVKHH